MNGSRKIKAGLCCVESDKILQTASSLGRVDSARTHCHAGPDLVGVGGVDVRCSCYHSHSHCESRDGRRLARVEMCVLVRHWKPVLYCTGSRAGSPSTGRRRRRSRPDCFNSCSCFRSSWARLAALILDCVFAGAGPLQCETRMTCLFSQCPPLGLTITTMGSAVTPILMGLWTSRPLSRLARSKRRAAHKERPRPVALHVILTTYMLQGSQHPPFHHLLGENCRSMFCHLPPGSSCRPRCSASITPHESLTLLLEDITDTLNSEIMQPDFHWSKQNRISLDYQTTCAPTGQFKPYNCSLGIPMNSLSCHVSRLSLGLSVNWFKNGEPINTATRLTIIPPQMHLRTIMARADPMKTMWSSRVRATCSRCQSLDQHGNLPTFALRAEKYLDQHASDITVDCVVEASASRTLRIRTHCLILVMIRASLSVYATRARPC